jgi:lambda family phage tail tape measure protein
MKLLAVILVVVSVHACRIIMIYSRTLHLNRMILLNQLQSGDIDQSLYDKKKEALQNSLDERLKIQEEYYKKQDELQNDGAAGFISGLATQIEASMDLYTNMQQVGAQAFSSLTDMIINWAETGKLNVKDFAATFLQSVGSTLLSYAAAQVAMAGLQAFTAMIGVPFVGPEIAGPAAIAATAAAGVLAIGRYSPSGPGSRRYRLCARNRNLAPAER